MRPEVLAVCVDAIESWDGEDERKLTLFENAVRSIMGKRDRKSTHEMTVALLQHDPGDEILARVSVSRSRLLDLATKRWSGSKLRKA